MKEKDATSFEYTSKDNMFIYLKGAMKKNLTNINQSMENIISYETIDGHYETSIRNDTYTKKNYLFDYILSAQYKNGKDVFTDKEKNLINQYHVQNYTYQEIGNKEGKKKDGIKKQIDKINRV